MHREDTVMMDSVRDDRKSLDGLQKNKKPKSWDITSKFNSSKTGH